MNFKKTSIGNVCFIGDGAHASIQRVENGIAYLTSKNFNKEGINLKQVEYISVKDYQKHFRENSKALTKPKEGDLIFSIIGSIGGAHLYNSTDEFGLSSSVAIIRPDNYEVNSSYLLYYFKSSYLQKWVENIKSGSAQGFLSLEMIKRLPLILPPLPIQQEIATILFSYDELIENNKQRIKLLEEMAEEIYKEWFVRLRFSGYENTKIVNGLPEGWENTKVENVLKTSSGGTPSRLKEAEYYGGNIDWIKTGELKDAFILKAQETITEIGLKNSSAKLFPANTLLMAMYGVNIGQLGISVKASAANQAVCVFNPINEIKFSLYYTFYFFKSIRMHLFNISMGAAQQNLSQDLIKKIDILKPKTEIITKYDLIVEPMFEEIKVLTKKNQLLQETRDLLLPRLISGKLSVAHLVEEELGMVAEPKE